MHDHPPLDATTYCLDAITTTVLSKIDLPVAATSACVCVAPTFAFYTNEIALRKAGIIHFDLAFVLFFIVYSLILMIRPHSIRSKVVIKPNSLSQAFSFRR